MKMEIIKPWITQRVTELLGFEDDIVINFVFSQLEEEVRPPHLEVPVLHVPKDRILEEQAGGIDSNCLRTR